LFKIVIVIEYECQKSSEVFFVFVLFVCFRFPPSFLSLLLSKKERGLMSKERGLMSKEKLKDLLTRGNANEVKELLEENPTFNVNEGLNPGGWSALHLACWKGHDEIVSVLLNHPQINVNQKSESGSVPLLTGCYHGNVELVKLLLKDSRVNVNLAQDDGCTSLWWAVYWKHIEVIQWMIVLRGDELDMKKKGRDYDKAYNAIELARKRNQTEIFVLLERFVTNPAQIKYETHLELCGAAGLSAELFALMVFLCDDLLKVRTPAATSLSVSNHLPAVRFFNIATKLPMELQMVLCYRLFGSSKENIISNDSEIAFRSLAKSLRSL
jgi:ankyrin repeat protein